MVTKICLLCFMHSYFLTLLFIWLDPTTAVSLGHQLTTEGGGDADGAINKCIDKEKHVLLDFKARLQDPDGRLLLWGTEDDCCKWSGVTCNYQTSHVTKLDLSYKNDGRHLNGEISPSLFHLSYLNHLDLSDNNFNGTILKSIGFLTELRYLNLSMNSFNGTIPESIGFLTELRYLDLSSNHFVGTIPESIGFLTELRYLDLSGNYFSGTITPEFGNLKNLRNLSLGSLGICQIENLDWLCHLSNLQSLRMDWTSLAKANHWVNVILSLKKLSYLSLRSCDLSQVMYPYSPFVDSSSSIQVLDLESNNLNSSMYRWLFPLTNNRLHELHLSDNMLDGIPRYFGNLCGLESLYLEDNNIAVKFPDLLINLSGCTSVTLKELFASENQLTGSLSDEIQKFSSLEGLYLSNNHLNGTISEKLLELPFLETLDVSSNSLRGNISSENILKSNIRSIEISKNSLEVIPSKAHMSNLSHVEVIQMRDCRLGPSFPHWIQTQKNLTYLDIGNTGILDSIPVEFWNIWPSQLMYLNLSSNNISGEVSDLSSNFYSHSSIDLSRNNLSGPIPNVSSTVVSLNLSWNKFFGGISFICQIFYAFLQHLDLSHNSFSGQLPDCLWHFKELVVLNLGDNNLSGRLPTSIRYLVQLQVLHLYNNRFSGELPFAMNKCTELRYLDLGANNFSGNVPVWIGEKLTMLYTLSLKVNNFFGPIPLQLCHLKHLQILDLSVNNINGTIPSCVNNLTAMVEGSTRPNIYNYYYAANADNGVQYNFGFASRYIDSEVIGWHGNELVFTKNLVLLFSIDLSSNNLTGQIPYELFDLHKLLVLNLSKNCLEGGIPQKMGELKELLVLDLSRNTFSGGIPSSMSLMTRLDYLDISHNNLSGRIPTSTQLQTFDQSRYTGNVGLCGPPITKYCPGDEELEAPPPGESEGGGEGIDELQKWFYIGGGTGFLTGFWIVCGALLLSHNLRHAFVHFLDGFKDWLYVKVVVFIRKLQRVA